MEAWFENFDLPGDKESIQNQKTQMNDRLKEAIRDCGEIINRRKEEFVNLKRENNY